MGLVLTTVRGNTLRVRSLELVSLGRIKKSQVHKSVEWCMEVAVVVVGVKGGGEGREFGEVETET